MLKLFAISFLFAISGQTIASDVADEVLILANDNFDQAINHHNHILVQFYAPSCSHCKVLAPEYSKAAKQLSLKGSEIKLAKVDATSEVNLADRYGVQGYPTLKFFIGGKPIEFTGGRKAEEIVSWLEKKVGPPGVLVTSLEQLSLLINDNTIVVVGFLTDLNSELTKVFLDAARFTENIPFAIVPDPALFAAQNVTEDKIVMFKNFDEGKAYYNGDPNFEELTKFINSNSMPLLVEFSYDFAPMIFGGSIKDHLLLFTPTKSDDFQSLKDMFTEMAKAYKGKLLFVMVDSNKEELKMILHFFGVTENELPGIRIISLGEDMKKYKPSDPSLEDGNVRIFVDQFLAGGLKPNLLSEDIPEDWDSGSVKILVGKNFNSVANGNKSMLVMFYAPWCGHCKQLGPLWDELGEYYKDSDMIIAKMDSTKNELEDINIKAFPTIKLITKVNLKGKDYNGERTFEGLVKFVTSDGMDGGAVDEDDVDYDETTGHDEL